MKSISAKLCPPVSGQAVMDVIVNPPQPHEPSYKLFEEEKEFVLAQLREKVRQSNCQSYFCNTFSDILSVLDL